MVEAADVMNRLPEEKVQGYFSTWPAILREWGDLVGQTPQPMRMPPPSPQAISRMDETLTWLRWLEPEEARLVWARAEGTPWKPICWRFGISRATANRRWQYGIAVIVWRLNGKRVPARRSRAFVVSEAPQIQLTSFLDQVWRHMPQQGWAAFKGSRGDGRP